MRGRSAEALLPSPGIAFGDDFPARLGRLRGELASSRDALEGAGRNRLLGVGAEFVGYRPYRPGEDLRVLDWSLYARHRRPFVRVSRREASEAWAILLDTSASMGVGVPGKLQCAAEVATALAVLGVRVGATVELHTPHAARPLVMRRPGELVGWMRLLGAERASGDAGLDRLFARASRVAGAGRLFAVGDLLDVEPRALERLVRRGRELFCVQLLAPEELAPAGGRRGAEAVEWVDAESGAARTVAIDRRAEADYRRRLARRLDAWRATSSHHRARFGTWSSAEPFEHVVRGILRG